MLAHIFYDKWIDSCILNVKRWWWGSESRQAHWSGGLCFPKASEVTPLIDYLTNAQPNPCSTESSRSVAFSSQARCLGNLFLCPSPPRASVIFPASVVFLFEFSIFFFLQNYRVFSDASLAIRANISFSLSANRPACPTAPMRPPRNILCTSGVSDKVFTRSSCFFYRPVGAFIHFTVWIFFSALVFCL